MHRCTYFIFLINSRPAKRKGKFSTSESRIFIKPWLRTRITTNRNEIISVEKESFLRKIQSRTPNLITFIRRFLFDFPTGNPLEKFDYWFRFKYFRFRTESEFCIFFSDHYSFKKSQSKAAARFAVFANPTVTFSCTTFLPINTEFL